MTHHATRLRRRLLTLVIAATLPVLGLSVLDMVRHDREDRAEARTHVLRLVTLLAAQQEQVLAGAEHLLATLSTLPELRRGDADACHARLSEVVRRFTQYANMGVIRSDGRAICNALVPAEELPYANPDLMSAVRRAIERQSFAIGGFGIGTITRKTVFMAAFPLADERGRPAPAAVAATIDLRWLSGTVERTELPRGAVLMLVDSAGTVLTQVGGDAAQVGRSLAGEPLHRLVAAGGAEGVGEARGLDGGEWVAAWARLAGPVGQARPVLVLTQPATLAYAAAARSTSRSLLMLLATVALALAAAWLLGNAFVARRVEPLVAAARRVEAGDVRPARVPVRDGDELGELARALEGMTAALHQRAEEARRAIEATRHSEERYRALVRATSQTVWSTNAAGFLADPAEWSAFTGQTPDEARGHGWLDAVHPEDRERVEARVRRTLDDAGGEAIEFRVRSADGGWRRVRSYGTAVREPDGSVREVVSVLEDVTEQRRAEETLRRVEEQYRQAQKMEAIGRLAGGVAHDFNNQLAAIASYAQLLAADPSLGDAQRDDVQEIRKAADRAAALVRQLLAVSRRQTAVTVPLDVNATIADLERTLHRLAGPAVRLDTRCEATALALGDEAQLEQALLNLVTNARDAMPDGGQLVIATSDVVLDEEGAVRLGVAPGAYVALTVSDEGTGMDDATRSRMFEPFFTTKERGRGTGLGLTTVYAAAVQHGGAVEVESRPGGGTTIRLLLRRAPVEEPIDAPAAETLAPAEPVPSAAQGHGTVLLVDDELPVRHATARLLREHGFTVQEAGSGVEALERLAEEPAPDVLLSDVVMPHMSGVELAHRARRLRPALPVVLLSGYAADAIATRQSLPEGAVLIGKPAELGALLRALDGVVTNS